MHVSFKDFAKYLAKYYFYILIGFLQRKNYIKKTSAIITIGGFVQKYFAKPLSGNAPWTIYVFGDSLITVNPCFTKSTTWISELNIT